MKNDSSLRQAWRDQKWLGNICSRQSYELSNFWHILDYYAMMLDAEKLDFFLWSPKPKILVEFYFTFYSFIFSCDFLCHIIEMPYFNYQMKVSSILIRTTTSQILESILVLHSWVLSKVGFKVEILVLHK